MFDESTAASIAEEVGLQLRSLKCGFIEVASSSITVQCWTRASLCYVVGHISPWRTGAAVDAMRLALTPPELEERQGPRFPRNGKAKLRKAALERARLPCGRVLCHWCRRPTSKWSLDHLIPFARGGASVAENLVLACPRCNESRGADMPELRGKVRVFDEALHLRPGRKKRRKWNAIFHNPLQRAKEAAVKEIAATMTSTFAGTVWTDPRHIVGLHRSTQALPPIGVSDAPGLQDPSPARPIRSLPTDAARSIEVDSSRRDA